MKNKFEVCLENIENNDILICPYCKSNLIVDNHSLKCNNNHNFTISKKGEIYLLNSSKYKHSSIYNRNLFLNRRNFINKNYYHDVYLEISNFINSLNKDLITILDLGSGEGTHMHKICDKLNINYKLISIDYSKDAINLATDYNINNLCIIGDINNLPFQDKSIDIIVDFLSPYNGDEIKRVLKDDGKLIKIVPGDNYLKELRDILDLDEYKKKDEVKNNMYKYFNIIKETEISNNYVVNEDDIDNLIKMSPLRSNLKDRKIVFNNITINNIIYFGECK